MVEFIGSLIRYLVCDTFLSGVGYFIVKFLTLGRYPRTLDLRKPTSPDFEILAMVGLLGIVVSVIFLTWVIR